MGLSSAVTLDIIVTVGLSYYLRKSKSGFSRYGTIQMHSLPAFPHYLRSMNEVIDTLILYTVETGLITWCVVHEVERVVNMFNVDLAPLPLRRSLRCLRNASDSVLKLIICQWLIMPRRLIFLGIHFAISKCMPMQLEIRATWAHKHPLVYVNTFLATYVIFNPNTVVTLTIYSLNSRARLRVRNLCGARSNERVSPFLLSLTADGRQRSATSVRSLYSIMLTVYSQPLLIQARSRGSTSRLDSDSVSVSLAVEDSALNVALDTDTAASDRGKNCYHRHGRRHARQILVQDRRGSSESLKPEIVKHANELGPRGFTTPSLSVRVSV